MMTAPSPRRERVLLVEDDPGVGETVQLLLNGMGCQSDWVKTTADGVARALTGAYDLMITDLRLPDRDGLSIIRAVHEAGLDIPMILMTSYSSLDTAIEALRSGAVDYIIKPFGNDDFSHAVRRALSERRVRRENALLKRSARAARASTAIIGESAGIRRVLELINKVAAADANVLIQGESGTGKELVARAIHDASARARGPFVPINCGAIPAGLLESELFGHVKGAYTGAVAANEGLIREAHGGTVFLDEISEMETALQVKLLRVIQDRQVRPLGARHVLDSDVRFVAASNRDLKLAMEQGTFRADLYYRLNVINVTVPPLRERGADIELLAGHFMQVHGRQLGKRITRMDDGLRGFLQRYNWPGNVRELENLIERAVILADGDTLSSNDIADAMPSAATRPLADFAAEAVEQALSVEQYIEQFVRRYQHFYSEAELARLLGMGRKALWVRRNRWGLKRGAAPPAKHERVS
jgi:DNA-binding NtrC family response regulator